MKAQALVDHLAENPIDDEYQPPSTYFPDEKLNSVEVILENTNVWKMFFDGAAQGEWETRDIKLIPYKQHVEDLSKWFKFVEFRYILRFHNELADALATLASMLPYPGNVHIDLLEIQWQIHGDLIHAPPSELHPMSVLWPFVARGMDVIGPIEPKASNGHRFILVAIDYFTKWVEVVTFKAVTKKAVVDFVHSNIICRFGIPKTIITDDAVNLNNHLMREVCEQFKITHRNSTPYWTKANGAIEVENKNIKKILRKMVQGSRQWHEKLPFALLGYRTSVGATPYLLVYGTEAVIPVEIEIPSLQIIVEAEIEDDEWVKTRLEQLTMIDKKRMAAVCHGQLYQQRMARAYNKKVRPRKFFRIMKKPKENLLQIEKETGAIQRQPCKKQVQPKETVQGLETALQQQQLQKASLLQILSRILFILLIKRKKKESSKSW
ncbi:uncharacterized protein [Nicotiana tomentosiformis]|uniref:uncharacterized protein n=1 Tax=Nicotiana tomentosiformis TaxID=4098 RepID=UPI00388CBA20